MTDHDQTETTPREQAVAAMDAAEKALTWTTSLGYWVPVREYMSGRRGLVKHQQTGDDLAEFVYPADAEHACLWHPRRVKALIDRDRATLERHKPDTMYSDGACPCGWEGDQCPEANAVIAFWTSDDMPDIVQPAHEQIEERLAEAMAASWMGDEVDCADVAAILAPAVVALVQGTDAS